MKKARGISVVILGIHPRETVIHQAQRREATGQHHGRRADTVGCRDPEPHEKLVVCLLWHSPSIGMQTGSAATAHAPYHKFGTEVPNFTSIGGTCRPSGAKTSKSASE